MNATMQRRHVLGMAAAAAAGEFAIGPAQAADTIKIGAVLPLAGAFAASGTDMRHGAELAVAEVNAAGGIKSIGGRKIELTIGDAGQSPETVVTTARRILDQQPVACIGSWFSSLTLAATQVAEQKKIPWLTGSIADAIVGRGFKYVYQISAGSADLAQGLIDSISMVASGKLRLSLLIDNNTANVDVKNAIKKKLPAEQIVNEETWTPPLSDATPVVTAVLQSKPSVIYLGATSTTDQALLLKQLSAQGNKALILMGASSAANPAFISAVGVKNMEGLLVVTGVSFPGKGTDAINKKFAEVSKLAFMDCEAFTGYINIHIIAQALQNAGKATPDAVQQALKSLDAQNVPSLSLLPNGHRLRFGPNGRREGTVVELVQWQDGRPRVVFPADVANGKLMRSS